MRKGDSARRRPGLPFLAFRQRAALAGPFCFRKRERADGSAEWRSSITNTNGPLGLGPLDKHEHGLEQAQLSRRPRAASHRPLGVAGEGGDEPAQFADRVRSEATEPLRGQVPDKRAKWGRDGGVRHCPAGIPTFMGRSPWALREALEVYCSTVEPEKRW